MPGGTEAFPDLGRHCQHSDCNLLDFLPFSCDGCHKVFCLEHRSYKSHECPNSDLKSRKVIICEICSTSIETTGGAQQQEEKMLLEKHVKSGNCDPSKKKKPRCPVRRCKETLTFSNTATCKNCGTKVCLKHRFPADHVCMKPMSKAPVLATGVAWKEKFMAAFAVRTEKDCAKSDRSPSSTTSTSTSVKAC